MKLRDIISISPQILEGILLLEVRKIPGLAVKNIKKLIADDEKCSITIYITPFSALANIHSIACEIQQAINFYLTSQFDVKEGEIKINVVVLAGEGE
ncbi:MAG: hypothetical protein MJ209_07940 [archaeon]|nr:hypothetical protein [archaeon]